MSTAVFGAPEWRARSGRKVMLHGDGAVVFEGRYGYIGAERVADAEEYFQARRDAELGRWRWPENPDWIVYLVGDDAATAMNEKTGEADTWSHKHANRARGSDATADAALAYFQANPGRKPWHLAEAGQVWVLTVPDPGDVDAEIVTVATTYGTFTAGSTREWVLRDPVIRTARRVPTEVAS